MPFFVNRKGGNEPSANDTLARVPNQTLRRKSLSKKRLRKIAKLAAIFNGARQKKQASERRFSPKAETSLQRSFFCGSLQGSRTPHSAVKGRRLNRLTRRPQFLSLYVATQIIILENRVKVKRFFQFYKFL